MLRNEPGPTSKLALLVSLLCTAAFACSSAPKPVVTHPAPPPSAAEKLPAGSTLTVPRPTPGVAKMALWIDAGSRDAKPPQLATAAAWWAAERSGVEVRVEPDGTEFSLVCDTRRSDVGHCIQQLAHIFAPGAPSAADALRLREGIRRARERAASDVRRAADELAVRALFGDDAKQLMPFGEPAGDEAVETNALVRFGGDYYVPSHALLIAAGDVDEASVARRFAEATAHLNSPGKLRNGPSATLRSQVLVETAPESWLALAMGAETFEAAAAVTHRFREIYADAEVRAASLRGVNLVHVRMPAGDHPVRRLQRAVFDLKRLARETQLTTAPRADESVDNIVRLLGESWSARGGTSSQGDVAWPVGAGLTLRVGPESVAESTTRLQRAREEAQAAFEAAERNSLGEVQGEFGELEGHAKARNGLRIEIVRRPGDAWMSAVVRFRGGSGLDPLTRHGRAALLAVLMADSCGFASGTALDARLLAIDAEITPLVDAEHVGLMIHAPVHNTEAAVDALLRCAVRPALTTRAMEDARLKLLRSIWNRSETRLRAALGQLLWSTAPGNIAPWGSPNGLSAVQIQELRRFHAELLTANRSEILVVADRAPKDLASFVARRVGQLPVGTAAPVSPAPLPPQPIRGELTQSGPLRAIVGLRATTTQRDDAAADVLAGALAEQLAPHVRGILGRWGGTTAGEAWLGVAMAVTEDELAGLEAHVRTALQQIEAAGESALLPRLERLHADRTLRLSSAEGYARAFFAERSAEVLPAKPDAAMVRKLTREAPAIFVLRPTP